jgi:CHASE2 domain-containing sensor protein/signal transduction histidine kinase
MRHAARTEWRLLTTVLALLCAVLGWTNGLGRADWTLYDYLLTSGDRPRPDDVLIIAIDEASLEKIGRWPWSRTVHASMLERLAAAKPKVVGVDLILSEPEPGADERLAASIRRLPLVLPALTEAVPGSADSRSKLPAPALAAAAKSLGHIRQFVDGDGIARSTFLRDDVVPSTAGTPLRPHFALAILALADPAWNTASLPGYRNRALPLVGQRFSDYEVHFPLYGGSRRIERVSYVDVLEGRIAPARFDGKHVFVGATAAGLGDAYATPISGHSSLTPGIEIHANLLDALRSGRTIEPATQGANLAFNLVPLLLVMLALGRLSPRRGLAVTIIALAALPLAATLLLRQGIWFAPAAGLLCIATAYPLWSWRRLEASVRYLGDEFRRLAAEPRVLPEADAHDAPSGDIVESRMLALASAADRLRNLRRFVSDTLESLPDAALVTDREGVVLIGNRSAAALFKTASSGELRGRSMAELLSSMVGHTPQEPAPTWDALKDLAGKGAQNAAGMSDALTPSALECLTRDERSQLARCAALAAPDGTPGGWIITFSDISDLREAERTREEVLAFLSHDMRSPQSSIIALLELHELDPDDNPKEEVHKRIEQYARRTLALSEQFLQLARAETKVHEPTKEDFGAIAEEAVDDVWAAAEQKAIRVEMKWDGEPLPVEADRPLLLRAVFNLLTNAVKYSPEKTRVTVTVAERMVAGKPMHVCEVADQGYGISAENQEKLFERYRRFSEPGQPKAQGAGLGMAFVKTVIEKHGGTIGVASVPGEGSTFTLILPPVTIEPDEEFKA